MSSSALQQPAIIEILNALESHALASGWFDSVNIQAPDSPPGHGMHVAIWSQAIGPAPGASGLASTTGRVEWWVQLMTPITSDSKATVERNLMAATHDMLCAYGGDFSLDGLIKHVDILGAHGQPLSSTMSMVEAGGQTVYRASTIVVPLIINDLWAQVP